MIQGLLADGTAPGAGPALDRNNVNVVNAGQQQCYGRRGGGGMQQHWQDLLSALDGFT